MAPRVGGAMIRFGFFSGLAALIAALPAGAVVLGGQAPSAATSQAQMFHTQMVSRVWSEEAGACMISTGSDWKTTGAARRGDHVDAYVAAGQSVEEAFALTGEVDVLSLASNTPYLSFVSRFPGEMTGRVATGFAIEEGSLKVHIGGEFQLQISANLEIEPRGDTAALSDPDAVATLFEAFETGAEIRVTARSSKQDRASEHYVRYQFVGAPVQDALNDCHAELAGGDALLSPSRVAAFSLVPAHDVAGSERVAVRGMACNRDLDPNGAELLRLSGPIEGFSTPLRHALVQRDENGMISEAWSGDFWRLSQTEAGYELRVSNSILAQSPLGDQTHKACTRYAEPICAQVEMIGEKLIVGPCFGPYIAGTGLAPINVATAKVPSVFTASSSRGGGGSGFSGGGGGSGGGAISPASQQAVSTYSVVNGGDPEQPRPQPPAGQTSLTSIPIPPAWTMFLAMFPLFWVVRRSAKRPA